MTDGTAVIEVVNAYQWMGDPRFGKFHVYVDGVKAGVAPIFGSLQTQVAPGDHKVRVRLWWYRSPLAKVRIAPGQTVHLEGDIPRELSLGARIVRMLFRPGTSLTLTT
jgi:hypothetical protein